MCILCVEDEIFITMVAEDALHDAGHEVVTALDSPAAVKLVRDHVQRPVTGAC